MGTTAVIVLVFVAIQLVLFVLWMALLRFGLRWVKVPLVTWRRLVLASLLCGGSGLIVGALHLVRPAAPGAIELLVSMIELVASVAVSCLVIKWLFRTSVSGSFQAWLPTLLNQVIAFALVLLIVRPFVVEAFQVSSNAMAPTLLGNHWQGVCEVCGSPAFCSAALRPFDQRLMICQKNFHMTSPTNYSEQALDSDRMLVVKYLRPRRWDMVVFQYPANPETSYVMRIAGMPGEEITIRDGEVWADGQKTVRPESIIGLKYLTEMDGGPDLSGTIDNPAKLGDDEYFVLGDFSARSNDSRLWTEGAEGHPRYAVPASHIRGVVSHIYWPFERMRMFR